MVTQARFEPDAVPNPPRDQRLARRRPGGAAAGPMRHTVASGESFAMIAQLYYGSARYDKALQSFNRGLTARSDRLSAGDLIVIPRVDELDASQIGPMKSKSTTAPVLSSAPAPFPEGVVNGDAKLNLPGLSEARSEPADQTVGRNRENIGDDSSGSRSRSSNAGSGGAPQPVHVVRRYETLRSIARDRLGDSRRAGEIIELNRDRVPAANQLTPGQRLLLPADATPASQAR
jgi:nucleoid-associated protein YgaU